MSTPTKPGWVDVPGKGRRYWTGSEYRFEGPSDNPANKGQWTYSNDIAGWWNNFVSKHGRTTSNPKEVGAQNMTPAQIEQKKREIAARNAGGSKDSKTPPTAEPAVKPYRSRREGLDATYPDRAPSFKPEKPAAQPDGGGSSEPRVNANGLVSYGKDLSSLNAFTSAFTGGYELTDIKSAFQSNGLPTTPSGEKQGHEAPRTNYSWDSESEEGVWNDETGRLELPTAPGTTGGKPVNAQDGTSSKPDVAESIRTVRMERQSGRGSRRDPRNRGENADMFGGPEPSDESLTSPMYANAKRNEIRRTFLDHKGSSVQAIIAANAVAGYGKDSDGNARFNYGGELVNAKDGMQQKAKNAAMMGQDPSQYLQIGDTPAASELAPTPASTVKPGTIEMPENTGGSIEAPTPILKPDPAKQKEAEDFLNSNISMLTRKTK